MKLLFKEENTLSRNFWMILILVVAGLFGLVVATSDNTENSGSVASIEDPRVTQANDNIRGENAKNVTLIEYGDFGCPGCSALHTVLVQLEEEFNDEIEVIFRHFPLIQIHPNAMAAHRAAEAAKLQDKFWEMHDILYERQLEWVAQGGSSQAQAIAVFETYATEIGLDIEQYKTDVASQAVFDAIDVQINSGTELGLSSTPSLLLNGVDIDSPSSYEELKGWIEEEITKADTAETTETPASTEAEAETEAPAADAEPAPAN